MKFKSGLLALVFCTSQLIGLANNSASAVLNGEIQKANPWTVAITIQSGSKILLCSGVLVETTTVMTAKHCVVDAKGQISPKILINAPGNNYTFPPTDAMEQQLVSKVVLVPEEPTKQVPDEADVAFLKFSQPFKEFSLPEIATPDQIAQLKTWSIIKGYGYGAVGETNSNYSKELRQYDLSWGNDDHNRQLNVVLIASASSIGCSGDSGGPITAFLDEKREVLIGIAASIINQGSNGCAQRDLNQLYFENFNLVYPYIGLQNPKVVPPKPTKVTKAARKPVIKKK